MRKNIFLLFFLSFVISSFSQEKLKTINLNEVVIKSKVVSQKLYNIDTIGSKTIENTSFSDVGKILKSIPNVSGIKKGAFGVDPVIRGFKFSQINVVLNGAIKVEGGCPNRMDPAVSHIDVSELKKVELYKGTAAFKYGQAFGGTVNLITWQPVFYNKYKTGVLLMAGLQNNGPGYKNKINVNGAGRVFTYSFSAGSGNFDDYKDGNGNFIKSSVERFDFTGNLGFRLAKNHIIDGGIIVSKGRNVDFPALTMDERDDNTNIYSLNYTYKSSSKGLNMLSLKSWYSDVNHVMDNKNRSFSDTVVAVSDINATDKGIRGYGNFNLGKGVFETGFDVEIVKKDGQRVKHLIKQPGLPVKKESLWKNAFINNSGFYSGYILPGNKMDWIAALRFDYNYADADTLIRKGMTGIVYRNANTESSYLNISLNGGFTWHVKKNYDLSVSAGRGVRSPDMTERFIILLPVGYDRFDYVGNPQLKPEKNYELNIKNSLSVNYLGSIDAALFFSFVTDFIGSKVVPPSELRPQTPGVLGVKRFENIDKVWLTGFEFSYLTPSGKNWQASVTAAYTYAVNPEAEVYELEFNNIIGVKTVSNDPLPEIPPFECNVKIKYGFFNNKLIPEAHWRFVAARKKVSASYMEQESEPFQLLNLKLKYAFNSYLTLYGGVDNLFDVYYYEHLNRNIIGSAFPLYEPGRNFYVNLIVKF